MELKSKVFKSKRDVSDLSVCLRLIRVIDDKLTEFHFSKTQVNAIKCMIMDGCELGSQCSSELNECDLTKNEVSCEIIYIYR